MMRRLSLLMLFTGLLAVNCSCRSVKTSSARGELLTGAMRTGSYLNMLSGKALAIVANQTSVVGKRHLVDTLAALGMDIRVIFAPEHGFREMADDGALIADGRDPVTGIKITSLYGSHRKPAAGDLKDIDIVLFDIQDVGARFYTYISTMTLVMESCAELGKTFIVLDRPNPNGFYIDGNITDTAFSSFVGMHPVPVVHGMTAGEYASMVNGEGWLKGGVKCDLKIITCISYDHDTLYELPVQPSPNLPNQAAVYLYPSLCFFEGTAISCGRGTEFPFQVFGAPGLPDKGFSFTPVSTLGAKSPMYMGQKCYGTDLRDALRTKIVPVPHLNLEWLINAYNEYPDKEKFFTGYFDILAGGPVLREQIIKGMSVEEIRASWKQGLDTFIKIRERYLIY